MAELAVVSALKGHGHRPERLIWRRKILLAHRNFIGPSLALMLLSLIPKGWLLTPSNFSTLCPCHFVGAPFLSRGAHAFNRGA